MPAASISSLAEGNPFILRVLCLCSSNRSTRCAKRVCVRYHTYKGARECRTSTDDPCKRTLPRQRGERLTPSSFNTSYPVQVTPHTGLSPSLPFQTPSLILAPHPSVSYCTSILLRVPQPARGQSRRLSYVRCCGESQFQGDSPLA